MAAPESATLFTFNVGFGDCFLLRFSYGDGGRRHVLIDFGSTHKPKGAGKDLMLEVAGHIKELCGGKLDIVVATHRHKDHVSGFATLKNGKGSGDIIAALNPSLVMQPWTEDPDVPEAATEPQKINHAFTKSLLSMNSFASSVQSFADSMTSDTQSALGFTDRERQFLSFIGQNNVSNKSAVENLVRMGKSSKGLFLHADQPAPEAEALLPGVKVHVLGPPTATQNPAVSDQATRNAEEYWHVLRDDGPARAETGAPALFPKYAMEKVPFHARWIKDKALDLRKDMLFSITTALDDAMNNTSLILVLEVGKKCLLFPGDAQWENWQYALSQPKYIKLLKSVDLYKVGHHGSLNATPKSLWELFEQKDTNAAKKNRLVSVMSSMHGVHGKSDATAVPRRTLVEILKRESHFHSTEDFGEAPYKEISVEF